ncbi:MAG: hypothetical protein FJ405_04850, partial [Verrucomicrobia bacterium]|nr:hypothetical protein [Verrucomicrobiota bacterium]
MEDIDRTRDKISTCPHMNYRSCSLATLLSSLTIAGVFQVSAATPTSKPAARKPAAPTSVVQAGGFLEAGPATVSAEKVNLRARPDVDSEPVGRLSRNDSVRVIEEIRNPKPGPGEPARWAKIALPESAHVWVFGDFLDKAASTVKVPRLNLRSGPGENHAVIGTLDKGAAVKKVEAKGDWWRIEAPASAVAYVAANLLQTKPVSDVVAVRSDNGLTPGTPPVPP